jgi:NAD(P)-dependent dehydrogenase (short-subunit alcohol dehydrogenase family)
VINATMPASAAPRAILVTGASSGIGRATVRTFSAAGWQVAATMRRPDDGHDLASLPGVRVLRLDVTSTESVEAAVGAAYGAFGRLDAVVNNAGYGVDGVFESMDDELIRRQFETNVFGLMRVTRAVLPLLRRQQEGTLVQVSSMGGRVTFPLYSIYHGTKWAVEGFTESLQYEVAQFNIKLKLIEPGAIKTEFYGRSRAFMKPDYTTDYNEFVKKCEAVSMDAGDKGASPEAVAKVIFKAANDSSTKMRYPIAYPANLLLPLRRLVSERFFFWAVKQSYRI